MKAKVACLTSVAVVSREICELSGLEWLVNDFLDASVLWTLTAACGWSSSGAVRLLDRIAAREDSDMDPLLQRRNFTFGLDKAVERGDVEVAKWLVETYLPAGRIRKPVRTALKHSRLEILDWLHANHDAQVVWDASLVIMDLLCSNLETLKWVNKNILPVDLEMKQQLMDSAVRYQLIDRIDWLNGLDLPFVQPDLSMAVRTGNISMVVWIRDHAEVQFSESLLKDAVYAGQTTMARWLSDNYRFSLVSATAIACGVRSLSFSVMPDDEDSVRGFLVWVLENLTIYNNEVLGSAIDVYAKFGDLEGVKSIHNISGNGFCSTDAMDTAATYGWTEIVVWLHENRSEGCTTKAMNGAAANGHLETLIWLHHNRTEGCTTRAMDCAAEGGHLEIVEWLGQNRSEGCTVNAMDMAALQGHIDIVKYLHEHRSEGCTYEAMNHAAMYGHLEIVKWLYDNRSEGCADSALHYATKNRHFEVMRWLHRCVQPNLQRSADAGFKYLTQELRWSDEPKTVSQAERAISWAIFRYTQDEVFWLLRQLPNCKFSPDRMMNAIQANKLEIAMMLAKDGRFLCGLTVKCVQQAFYCLQVEMFQWLVRDLSDVIPGTREFIEAQAPSNPFMRDALIELEHLTKSD